MKKIVYIIFLFILFSCEKKSNSTSNSSSNNGSGNCSSTQCTATASSTNQRCQNMTTNCAGLCHVHD